jgi:hypothetical protein
LGLRLFLSPGLCLTFRLPLLQGRIGPGLILLN